MKIVDVVRRFARGWEPAVAATVVAAVFILAAQLGIAVGDLPEKVDGVLNFVSVIAPLIAGGVIRQKVRPLALDVADEEADEDDDAFDVADAVVDWEEPVAYGEGEPDDEDAEG